jgi:Asp/Glu/hydantoin racemase
MHKNKLSKHKPVLTTTKPRNPVVAALVKNPKRNVGKHKSTRAADLTMLDLTEKEQ